MALIGYQERKELEALILERLGEHFEAHGPKSLLLPGLSVAVTGAGVAIVAPGLDLSDALAHVEVRTLFTAVCRLEGDSTGAIPREALPALAAEAANAAAQQVNRIKSTRATA